MTALTVADAPLVQYALGLADDALVLGHRLSEWCGHAPMLEEDIALANIALDLIGQARPLFAYAGEIEGFGRDEDQLAYLRDAPAFRNLLLVEQPNGDFAVTLMRQFLYSAFMDPFWRATTTSTDATLAAVAAKAEKEVAYHLRHSAEWVIRLGDGTAQSRARAQEALDELWMYTGEMFETGGAERALIAAGVAVDPERLRPEWNRTVETVLAEATLRRPADGWMQTGGRRGRHSEHLGHILADLQFLQRAYPGATCGAPPFLFPPPSGGGWPGRRRGRRGGAGHGAQTPGLTRASAPGRPRPRSSTPRCRCSPSPISACCARFASRPRARSKPSLRRPIRAARP